MVEILRSGAEEPEVHRPLFKQEQKLRIIAGPYASLEAVFEMAEGQERATVLLDLLGRQSPVVVDVGQLVADESV